jgi:hypothetical protein
MSADRFGARLGLSAAQPAAAAVVASARCMTAYSIWTKRNSTERPASGRAGFFDPCGKDQACSIGGAIAFVFVVWFKPSTKTGS